MINFSSSTFRRVIMHKVHQKSKDESHSYVEHEDQLVDSEDEAKEIIKRRVTEACGRQSKSFKLTIAQVQPGSFFHLSKNMYTLDDDSFITRSKSIATLLGTSQKRSNIPGGYLIVIDGITDDNLNFLLVIKAELQEAFTTKTHSETKRRQIEVLKDIFLSPADKFFKIGVLFQTINTEETYPNNEYSCLIYDDQFRPGGEPAEFFYRDFLGFSIDKNEKLLTKSFYEDAKNLIENHAPDYETKRECMLALRTVYKQDQSGIIDPIEFGERFLPGSLRSSYAANVLQHPKYNRPFTKDLSLMGRELDKRILHFVNKVMVQAPEEVFDENIKIVDSLEEATRVINGEEPATLLKIKGKPYENA